VGGPWPGSGWFCADHREEATRLSQRAEAMDAALRELEG
jgi:hypothetical protein